MVVVGEFGFLFNVSASSAESFEDSVEISSLLHGNNSELIFFIDPHQESLLVIVEDTSAMGPVSVQVASLQESVSLPIIEIIVYAIFRGNILT
jgi:hypothetical protein